MIRDYRSYAAMGALLGVMISGAAMARGTYHSETDGGSNVEKYIYVLKGAICSRLRI